MARSINLDKAELVVITSGGLALEISKDNLGRILARIESEEGGRRITIKQHEEDAKTIVFALEKPGPSLTLVKE